MQHFIYNISFTLWVILKYIYCINTNNTEAQLLPLSKMNICLMILTFKCDIADKCTEN